MKKLCPRKDALLSGVSTQVGTSDCQKFLIGVDTSGKLEDTCSSVWGYHHVERSDKGQKFRLSGVPTQVGTFGEPNLKPYSDLAFWIPIWTILNLWETWKISLGEVFYWDKTTPSLNMRGSWPIEFPSIQSSDKLIYYLYSNPFTLFSNPHVVDPLICWLRMAP